MADGWWLMADGCKLKAFFKKIIQSCNQVNHSSGL